MWGLRRTNKRTPPNSQMRERRGRKTEKGVRRRPLPATRRAGLGTDRAAAGAPRGARGRGSRDRRGSSLSAVADASPGRRVPGPAHSNTKPLCCTPGAPTTLPVNHIAFFPKGDGTLPPAAARTHPEDSAPSEASQSRKDTRRVRRSHGARLGARGGVAEGRGGPALQDGSRGGRRGRRTCARGLRVSAEGAAAPGDRDREESGGPLGPLVAEGASRGVTPTSAQKHSPSALK